MTFTTQITGQKSAGKVFVRQSFCNWPSIRQNKTVKSFREENQHRRVNCLRPISRKLRNAAKRPQNIQFKRTLANRHL